MYHIKFNEDELLNAITIQAVDDLRKDLDSIQNAKHELQEYEKQLHAKNSDKELIKKLIKTQKRILKTARRKYLITSKYFTDINSLFRFCRLEGDYIIKRVRKEALNGTRKGLRKQNKKVH